MFNEYEQGETAGLNEGYDAATSHILGELGYVFNLDMLMWEHPGKEFELRISRERVSQGRFCQEKNVRFLEEEVKWDEEEAKDLRDMLTEEANEMERIASVLGSVYGLDYNQSTIDGLQMAIKETREKAKDIERQINDCLERKAEKREQEVSDECKRKIEINLSEWESVILSGKGTVEFR